MQFLLLEKPNFIHVGPKEYHRNYFKYSLEEDLGLENVDLPQTLESRLVINENVEIVPCVLTTPNYNAKIEMLEGPYWDFSNPELAQGTYNVIPKPVSLVQSELKARVADNRWRKEVSGVKVTIQGTEVSVSTNRDSRDVFIQALMLGTENKTWKFPEGFLVLSLSDIRAIVNAIDTHVQEAFNWERTKDDEIMGTQDLAVLDAIDLGDEKPALMGNELNPLGA
jgi:hypothetical protein